MTTIGNIDEISKTRVAGWAITIGDNSPVLASIYVNGLLIKTIRADLYRKDLEKVKGNGECAFELSIKRSLLDLLPLESYIEVFANGKHLPYAGGAKNIISGNCVDDTLLANQLKQGRAVNKNGEIFTPIKGRGEHWPGKALDDYQQVKEIFKREFDYDLCIAYGSLLGYIRENALIGHDDDLDASYVSKYKSPVEVAKETREIIRVIEKYGHQVTVVANGQFHVKVKNGIVVDIFSSWFAKDYFCLYFAVKSTNLKKEDIFPIREEVFAGEKVYVPNHPSTLLEAIYGKEWTVPDPYFQWRIDEETSSFFNKFNQIKA
jgi:hypothetical protein